MSIRKNTLCVVLVSCLANLLPHAVAQEYATNVSDFVPPSNYSTNAVFWISGHNLPEQTVLFNGAFTSAPKQVTFAPAFGYMTVSQALGGTNAVTVPAAIQGSTAVSAALPALLNTNTAFPAGPFAYGISDSTGTVCTGVGNLPTIYWTEGVPLSLSQSTEPLHQVMAGQGELGNVLRIFGRDFPMSSWVAITINGTTQWYNVYTTNPYELDISLTNQATGTGTIQVGATQSTPRDATFGATQPITIVAGSTMTSSTYTCTNLVGDGKTDNTTYLQADLNNNIPATNTAEYFVIPDAGTYVITNTITLNPHQYLVGGTTEGVISESNPLNPQQYPAGSSSGVVISGTVAGTTPSTWITGTSFFGLMNIGVEAPLASAYGDSIISTSTTTSTIGHVVLNGLTVTAENGNGNNSEDVELSGPDIQVVNSVFNGAVSSTGADTGLTLALNFANGGLVSGDQFNLGSQGWNTLGDCQNIIFENCDIGPNAGVTNASSAVSYVSGGNQNGIGYCVSQNIYTGGNTVSNIFGIAPNNVQSFTTDGNFCAYEGRADSTSGTSMTLHDAPVWLQHGNTYSPTNCIVSIIAGTGQGQSQFVAGASGNTITLSQPWAIPPDTTTSLIDISGCSRQLIFYGNTIANAGPFQAYGGAAQNWEIAHNILTNSAGIELSNQAYYGAYQPLLDVDIEGNQMTGTFSAYGNNSIYDNGLFMTTFSQGIISGVTLRGNVGDDNAFGNTNGIKSGFLEFDQAGWANRLCSMIEENESSPTVGPQVGGVSGVKAETLNPMLLCKENALTANQYLTGLTASAGTGSYGMGFTVGSKPITVTALGRWVVAGNNHTHTVQLYNSAYQPITGGSVSVDTSGATSKAFLYANLTTPLALQANTTYYLESQESSGTDTFYPYSAAGPNMVPSLGVTVNGASASGVIAGTANNSYGPVSLLFNLEMSMVESTQLGTLTSASASGLYGVEFTVGPLPIWVTKVGRWVSPGNHQQHAMDIIEASTGTMVAQITVASVGTTPGQYSYCKLNSPVKLLANTTYYLQSYENQNGDQFYNANDTFVVPGAGITLDGGVYGDTIVGPPNYTYGPVNMLFTY